MTSQDAVQLDNSIVHLRGFVLKSGGIAVLSGFALWSLE